jgi:hypothetical protein
MVERVAAKLIEHRKLNGLQIAALLGNPEMIELLRTAQAARAK